MSKKIVSADPQRPYFTNLQRLGYGMGNYGCCFSWMLVSMYLMTFMTDVALINPGTVGTVMLVSKLWDAINDPIIGMLSDRTVSRWGRYRPWILFATVPMLVINVLCFTTNPDWSETTRTVFAFAMYFILVLVYTCVNIPFSAMPAVLTLDIEERGKLSGWRMSGAFVTTLIISAFYMKIVAAYPDAPHIGWRNGAILFSVLALPCFIWCFLSTREVVQYKVEKVPLTKMLTTLKGNKPTWIILVGFLIIGVASGGTALQMYYFKYNWGSDMLMGTYGIIQGLGGIVGTLSLTKLVTMFKNKGHISVLAFFVGAVCYAACFFLPAGADWALPVYWVLAFINAALMGLQLAVLYGMAPDATEYTKYNYGIHAAGFTSSFINFGNKLGAAVMTGAAGWIMALTGYVANQAQSDYTLNMINFMCHLFVAIVYVIGGLLMLLYKLDNKTFNAIVDHLQKGEYAPGVTPYETIEQ